MNNQSLPKKTVYLFSAIFIVILATAGYFVFKDRFAKNPEEEKTAKTIDSVSISYPEGWEEVERNDEEKISGIILKLKESELGQTFLLRSTIGELDDSFNIDTLPDLVVSALEKEIYGFELVSKGKTKINSYDAVQIKYKQKYNDNPKVFVSEINIIPTEHQTFYLIFRGESATYGEIENDTKNISKALAEYFEDNL